MDTLKEIADILGSAQQSGTVLKRISDLESGKVDQVPGKGLSENDYTDADKAKLGGLSPQVQADYGQTNATAPDFIKNKPTIPAPVAVDATLAAQGAAADAKAVGDALRGGFTEWEFSGLPAGVSVERISYGEPSWFVFLSDGSGGFWELPQTALLLDGAKSESAYGTEGLPSGFTAVRHLITPTKTSQLTNDSGFLTQHQDISGKLDGVAAYPGWDSTKAYDYGAGDIVSFGGRIYRLDETEYRTGQVPPENLNAWTQVYLKDLKQDALSSAQLAAVNSGATAERVATWDGYASQIAQKANATDLPYAMVTPGEWTFSGLPSGVTEVSLSWDGVTWTCTYIMDTVTVDSVLPQGYDGTELSLTFSIGSSTITATRASLPGHLLDRANNIIDATTGNVTLTLPQFVEGKVRDLLVACTIGLDGNDEPWSVILQGQGSEAPEGANEISFKAEGDDAASATFPVPDAAGDWWYSLTERSPHVFAVSLKQLQSVSQPVTQGGS